jgi:drug/metabolite transporter (DMT)-like permease
MNATPPRIGDHHNAASQQVWLPALLIFLGMTLLPGMDAIAKALTGIATVSAISCVRNLTQMVIMAPFAWKDSGGKLWPLAHARLHALRGLCMVGSGLLFFAGVQRLPLADSLALSFIYPCLVACLSPLLLKEHLNLRQLLAILLGFAGTLIIIRPGSGIFGTAALLPLCSAIGYAGYVLVTRKLVQQDAPTSVLQFWMGLFGSLWVLPVFAIAMLFDLPDLRFHLTHSAALLGIIAMGVFGTCGHWLVTTGARHVSANVQAGLGYSEIITSSLLGWIFWRDFPDMWTWIGILIIIGSGIWLVALQTKKLSA